jgi:hypothetical protein
VNTAANKYVADFWRFVERRGSGECWPWRGPVKRGGYGFFTVRDPRKRTVYAHRQAYELLVGPIPAGLTIDHLCRVPGCANPAHMEVVTRSENNRRRRGFNQKARCRNGHEFTPANTRIDKRGFQVCRACHRDDQQRYLAARVAA